MSAVLSALIARIAPVAKVDFRIHTNGVLLDEKWCDLLDHFGVRIGISLDGDKAANQHRRFSNGKSSHAHVQRALALLRQPAHTHLYTGILCTIDLHNDPIAVYEALVAEAPPNLDLLLPHATWENPPYRPAGHRTAYADWLIQIYRRWMSDGRRIPIRFFDALLSAIRGGPSWTESIGLDPVDLLVIETDGSWEQPDSMKAAYDGAPATGLHVFSHSVEEAARHPGVAARQQGISALSSTCQACPVVNVCGGGLYAHRYRAGSGFDNPSVYCHDLLALINYVAAEGTAPAKMPSPLTAHQLSAEAFDALAAGPGNTEAVAELFQMRLSMTRALVANVAGGGDGWKGEELKQAAAEGWSLLCALDAEQPAAVREIFSHPYTCAWAIRCLQPPPGADRDLDRAHLAGLAAAAAMRADVVAELPLPIRDGMIHLPTVGAFSAGNADRRSAVVSISPGQPPVARSGGKWYPARYTGGAALGRVAVEDLDPFRDCQEWPVAGRLPELEWQAWQEGIGAAGRRLAAAVPSYAQVLRAGLRAVVPLSTSTAGERASTAYHAFGSVAVSFPRSPADLAALLLHEFQHVKLNAVSDLHVLCDRRYTRRLSVPWREDPRPLEGALHGTYAYLALMHLHRTERATAGGPLHAEYRDWVRTVTADMLATGALTPDGERFVGGMRAAAEADPP